MKKIEGVQKEGLPMAIFQLSTYFGASVDARFALRQLK